MALKTLVKVGEITNLSDARYCAGMGVEMLGFNLNPDSDSFVSPEQFKEITGWVAGVRYVGELNGLDGNILKDILPDYDLDMLQVCESNRDLLFDLELPVILSVENLDEPVLSLLQNLEQHVSYFLFESFKDEGLLSMVARDYPVLAGGEFEADSIVQLVKKTGVKGIGLKGSKEDKPGFKDYDQLADILEALETDD